MKIFKKYEEISQKFEERKMSTIEEASGLIQSIAGPAPFYGDNVKQALVRAGQHLNEWAKKNGYRPWSDNRVLDIWRGSEKARVSADELDQLRAVKLAREKADRRERLERSDREDLASIIQELRFLRERLAIVDPDFHRAAIEAFGPVAHENGAQKN